MGSGALSKRPAVMTAEHQPNPCHVVAVKHRRSYVPRSPRTTTHPLGTEVRTTPERIEREQLEPTSR